MPCSSYSPPAALPAVRHVPFMSLGGRGEASERITNGFLADLSLIAPSVGQARRLLEVLRNEPSVTLSAYYAEAICPSNSTGNNRNESDCITASMSSSLYLFMVVGRNDFALERLGRESGFPRGFPILWWPPWVGVRGRGRIQMHGFRPKFANDDWQDGVVENYKPPDDVIEVGCFKKWSGYLGQLIFFNHESVPCWTACSKNSADALSPFVQDATRLFRRYVEASSSLSLVVSCLSKRIHICAEMISKLDQKHGSRVGQEDPIVTSVGIGTAIDYDYCPRHCPFPWGKRGDGGVGIIGDVVVKDGDCTICTVCNVTVHLPTDNRGSDVEESPTSSFSSPFVRFFDFKESVAFCRAHGLPVGSAVVATGSQSSRDFLARLCSARDEMTNVLYDSIVADLVASQYDGKDFEVIAGTARHRDILGDTLEGLVIHLSRRRRGDFIIKTDVVKFKFPAYTIRTMCLRPALSDYVDRCEQQQKQHHLAEPNEVNVSNGGGSVAVRLPPLMRPREYMEFVWEWCKRWCVTESGRNRWRDVAFEAYLLLRECPADFPVMEAITAAADDGINEDDDVEQYGGTGQPRHLCQSVALHIRLADHIALHPPRLDVVPAMQSLAGSTVLLLRKVTVLLPFASSEIVGELQAILLDAGIPCVAKVNKKRAAQKKNGSIKDHCFVTVSTVPWERPQPDSTVYEFPPPDQDGLMDWQVKKLQAASTNRGDGVVLVDNAHELIRAMKERGDASAPIGLLPGGGGIVSSAEQRLRDAAAASAALLMEKLKSSGDEEWSAATPDGRNGGTNTNRPTLLVLVGPQCIGKSTAVRTLLSSSVADFKSSSPFVHCSADLHMKNTGDGRFDVRRLRACHTSCQRDAAAAVAGGKSAVVDNTNMRAGHRSIYAHIAKVAGARLLVHVLSPEMWLTCNEETRVETIDALAARARYRAAASTIAQSSSRYCDNIDRSLISRFVDVAFSELGGRPLELWTSEFPNPCGSGYDDSHLLTKATGVSMYRGALVYRDISIRRDAEETMKNDDRFLSHPDAVRGRLFREIQRDVGEYHITLISPKEMDGDSLKIIKDAKELEQISREATEAADKSLVKVGLGRVDKAVAVDEGEEVEWALFLVYSWPWAQEFRAAHSLPPIDCHVTLAFSNQDIHGVSKDASTCSW